MIKKINDKLKEIQNDIDLTKRFPGYFNKTIFRGVIIFMLIFTVLVFVSNDYKLRNVYIECDKNTPCDNPIYTCRGEENIYNSQCLPAELVPKEFKTLCENGLCDLKQLPPNTVYGNKPGFLMKNYNLICLLLVAFAFFINHIFYKQGLNKIYKQG